MTRRTAALVVIAVLAIAACGDQTPGEKALGKTQSHLEDIKSGTLDMTFLASRAGAPKGRGLGFALEGPFSVARAKGALPVADLEYTRITGGERRTTRFISTGRQAFVELDDVTYRLEPEQVADLRAGDASGGGLDGLELTDWIDEPEVTAAPRQGGVALERITGEVDAVEAFNGVIGLAHEYGASDEDAPAALDGDGADAMRAAVRSSTVELLVGRADHLLRRFSLVIELAPSAQAQRRLVQALGRFAGVRLAFDIVVDRPNRVVEVKAPSGAKPASAIPDEG